MLPAPFWLHRARGHPADGINKIQTNESRWYGSGERQTRRSLFVRCKTWLPQSKTCRKASAGRVGGSTRGRLLSECSFRTAEQPRRRKVRGRRGGRVRPALRRYLFLCLSFILYIFLFAIPHRRLGMERRGSPTRTIGRRMATGWLCEGVSDGDGKRRKICKITEKYN